jgi:AmiR/NasT family two-component response regulator
MPPITPPPDLACTTALVAACQRMGAAPDVAALWRTVVEEAVAMIAADAAAVVTERDNLNRAVAARHRVGVAQGILMTRYQLTADQAFTLLKRQSQNTNVKLRTIAQTVIQTGDLPVGGE